MKHRSSSPNVTKNPRRNSELKRHFDQGRKQNVRVDVDLSSAKIKSTARRRFFRGLCSAKIICILKRQAFQSEPDGGRQSPVCLGYHLKSGHTYGRI
jgi:hypothetical protein